MIPDSVERVALLGWAVYPRARTHRAAAFTGAAEQASCDLDVIEAWARRYPGCGWYAVTGRSGIWALDVDVPPKADGLTALRGLVAKHGSLPRRPVIRTGGGGLALVFRWSGEKIRGAPGALAPGLDARRGAHTITLPPSIHHRTGAEYRWLMAPWEIDPPVAPAWLLRLLAPPPEPSAPDSSRAFITDERARKALLMAVLRVRDAAPGTRNDTLYRASVRVGILAAQGHYSEQRAQYELVAAATANGLPRGESVATVRQAFRAAHKIAA